MPTPVSRSFMQTLKAKMDEEKRMKGVNDRVSHVYHRTIEVAELYSDKSYKYRLTHEQGYGPFTSSDTFYKDNMADILVGIQRLFPDCSVTHVNAGSAFEAIVIDWS